MRGYDLSISYPPMRIADQTHIKYLEATYSRHLIQIFLNRFGLTGKIKQTENEGPVFVISNIPEQDVETIQKNIVHMINQTVNDSNALRKYISSKDMKIEKKSNFDEIIKRLPELEGMF